MLQLTKTFSFLLICASVIVGGCSTVNQTLVLDDYPAAMTPGKLRTASVAVTAPKAGDVVFTYADLMPTYYLAGAKVSGGAKRADVIYALERGTEKIVYNALTQLFSIETASPYSVSGKLSFGFTEVPKGGERAGSQDIDVSILLSINLRVDKSSEQVFNKTYQAQKKDTNRASLITFPTNTFLNALFKSALAEALSTASIDKELVNAFGR